MMYGCEKKTDSNPKRMEKVDKKQTKIKGNRLAQEKSPYLLQHANNPVDWYPWGEEAFAKAKALDRPVFLSIGYSTCHWCHVMEHESFEDEEVANLMNQHFISIKVDREERPEIDHVYMSVCRAMTGRGGWPLTIIMTPDKEPFFSGTYFPKNSRGNRPGMMQLIPSIAKNWQQDRENLFGNISKIKDYLKRTNTKSMGDFPDESVLKDGFSQFLKRYDHEFGGFGKAPKFPSPQDFIFLLKYYHKTKDESALIMVENSLKHMRRGGIWDHIGFGFHRYSTDREWLTPHFEKMLYDQAMLSLAYLETYQITGNEFYAETARDIFTYVLRDMTSPEGGFYSAEDADSEGEEGLFYLWTVDEVNQILGIEDGERFITAYNMTEKGNFRDEATRQFNGKNIIHQKGNLKGLSRNLKISEKELRKFIQSCRTKLMEERKKRIHPLKDDKILTDWNGLMIAALSKGASVLKEPTYLKSAEKAADFVVKNLRDSKGKLLKRYRNGDAGLDGHLDDYAFMVWGLLNLYEAGIDTKQLNRAIKLSEIMEKDFNDNEGGGFFLGSDQSEKLIIRAKTGYDGAIPSGNSIAVLIFNRLYRMTGNLRWANLSEKTLRSFSKDLKQMPSGYTAMILGFMYDAYGSKEIVVVANGRHEETQLLLEELQSLYIPQKIMLFKDTNKRRDPLTKIASWTENHSAQNNKPTIYICEDFACSLPTTDLKKAIELIQN
ncbi:MAG TPA: thioredoxin domain-containing protein [Candidatus Marinimicrobia bacterium]|nr:thioredoxin domain-containing protein [Candidatus Neomarinimicrobiota bacterium]